MSQKNKLNVHDKIKKLDEMIAWFDSDDFDIEQALDRYSEAEKLANEINMDLSTLKNEISIIRSRVDEP